MTTIVMKRQVIRDTEDNPIAVFLPMEEFALVKDALDQQFQTITDAAKLARYCCLEAEFRTSPIEFPAAKLSQLRLMERDLYLDPEARAKIGVGSANKPSNPFDDL